MADYGEKGPQQARHCHLLTLESPTEGGVPTVTHPLLPFSLSGFVQVGQDVHRFPDLTSMVHRQGPPGPRGAAGAEGAGAGGRGDPGPRPELPLSEPVSERDQVGVLSSANSIPTDRRAQFLPVLIPTDGRARFLSHTWGAFLLL